MADIWAGHSEISEVVTDKVCFLYGGPLLISQVLSVVCLPSHLTNGLHWGKHSEPYDGYLKLVPVTQWGLNKMAAILQTQFSHIPSW